MLSEFLERAELTGLRSYASETDGNFYYAYSNLSMTNRFTGDAGDGHKSAELLAKLASLYGN